MTSSKQQLIKPIDTHTSNQKFIKIPALHHKPAFNEIYIKGNRPVPVYIKHAHKVLLKYHTLTIHALTAAINKAVKLTLHLMEEYPYLSQQVFTDSVPTLNIKNKSNQIGRKISQCQQPEQEVQGREQIIKDRAAIHIVLTKTLKK